VNSHELYAELERVRRDVTTARYELTILVNPDHVAARRLRLEQAEAEEQDILAELERLEKPAIEKLAKKC
jgi:hypothetical protein